MNTLENYFHNISNEAININNKKNDIKLNNLDISKPRSMQINSNMSMDVENNNNFSKDKTLNNENLHSIDFYALGKVKNYQKISQFIPPNNGFRSTSNNLIKRNYFSINNRYFDDLNNFNPKKQATIYEQNINENNYLAPINVFNTIQKYDLPSNVVNQETYNIAKEKLFAKDIFSQIKKGNQISKNDFISQKREILGLRDKQYLTPKNKSLNDSNINIKELKRYNSCINIKDNIDDNNKENDNNKLVHSSSSRTFIPKNPKDFTKEILTNSIIHFDKNHTNIVRDRNWWKINK